MSSTPSRFDLFSNMALANGAIQSPAALQGWLTGYVATGGRLTNEQWLAESAEYMGLPEAWESQAKMPLVVFYKEELKRLQSGELDYQLLLPDDETDFDVRMQGLADWAKGFLDGFGTSGRVSEADLNEDVLEVLKHYDAFSYGMEEEDVNEDSERLLVELVEHARVTALFMFFHFNNAQQAKPQVH